MGILGRQEALPRLLGGGICVGALLGHRLLQRLEICLDLAQLFHKLLAVELGIQLLHLVGFLLGFPCFRCLGMGPGQACLCVCPCNLQLLSKKRHGVLGFLSVARQGVGGIGLCGGERLRMGLEGLFQLQLGPCEVCAELLGGLSRGVGLGEIHVKGLALSLPLIARSLQGSILGHMCLEHLRLGLLQGLLVGRVGLLQCFLMGGVGLCKPLLVGSTLLGELCLERRRFLAVLGLGSLDC